METLCAIGATHTSQPHSHTATQPHNRRVHSGPCSIRPHLAILEAYSPRFPQPDLLRPIPGDRQDGLDGRLTSPEDAFGIATGTEIPPNAGANAPLSDLCRLSGRSYSLMYAPSDDTTRSLIGNLPNEEPNQVGTALRLPPCPDDLRPLAFTTRLP
jgi:hypothetical protein